MWTLNYCPIIAMSNKVGHNRFKLRQSSDFAMKRFPFHKPNFYTIRKLIKLIGHWMLPHCQMLQRTFSIVMRLSGGSLGTLYEQDRRCAAISITRISRTLFSHFLIYTIHTDKSVLSKQTDPTSNKQLIRGDIYYTALNLGPIISTLGLAV